MKTELWAGFVFGFMSIMNSHTIIISILGYNNQGTAIYWRQALMGSD